MRSPQRSAFRPCSFIRRSRLVLKYCGAGYLVYLGIAGFLSGGIAGIDGRVAPGARRSLATAYW